VSKQELKAIDPRTQEITQPQGHDKGHQYRLQMLNQHEHNEQQDDRGADALLRWCEIHSEKSSMEALEY
jgi:peptide methionine sulfoxide reductase MsrA